MKPRSQRRREERRTSGTPSLASSVAGNGLLIAGLIGVGVAIIIAGILLLAGGGGSENGADATPTEGTLFTLASPETDDEVALESLAQRLIDWLPQGRWAELYDEFTDAFRERCSRDAFAANGSLSAQEQGDQLTRIHYVGVNDFSVQDTTATLIIVGELRGSGQYTIRADFEKTGDVWQISAVPDSTGCDAFSRLSG